MAIVLKPLNQQNVVFTITSMTPMVQHKWSEKAKKEMRDKKTGVSGKTKNREKSVPEQEFQDATYLTEDGEYGIPAMAFKKSLICSAHKDIGIEKTLVRKAIFIRCNDDGGVLPITCDAPIMREDYVRVGMGTDLRWRPEFKSWSCEINMLVDVDSLPVEALINLVNRAGFSVGIGEMRPEKDGDLGRFQVSTEHDVRVGK